MRVHLSVLRVCAPECLCVCAPECACMRMPLSVRACAPECVGCMCAHLSVCPCVCVCMHVFACAHVHACEICPLPSRVTEPCEEAPLPPRDAGRGDCPGAGDVHVAIVGVRCMPRRGEREAPWGSCPDESTKCSGGF